MKGKFLLLLVAIVLGSTMWARKVTVTSESDVASNPTIGMLRYHIVNAVKNDTIIFGVSKVTLQGEISISDKTIVIDGGATALTTIDGNSTGRIFNITAYSSSTALTIKNLTLINGKRDNSSALGGAVYLYRFSGDIVFDNCIFRNNNAVSSGDGQGGAVRTNGGLFKNCTFFDNHVTGTTSVLGGGAVFAVGGTFINCQFAGNSAEYGGAIYASNDAVFNNCTITNNQCISGLNGAGANNEGGIFSNCIIWGNHYNHTSDNIKHYSGSYTNCAFESGNTNVGSNNNIGLTASPFVSSNYPYDLRLVSGSGCINAGTVTNVEVLEKDLAGNARIIGNVIDMGAFEYNAATGFDAQPERNIQVSVYPNPSDGELYIATSEIVYTPVVVEIFSSNGMLLFKDSDYTLSSPVKLNNAKGIVLVSIHYNNRKLFKKVEIK